MTDEERIAEFEKALKNYNRGIPPNPGTRLHLLKKGAGLVSNVDGVLSPEARAELEKIGSASPIQMGERTTYAAIGAGLTRMIAEGALDPEK